MSFFDDLQRFAEGVEKFLKGKPEGKFLKSCKNCTFYKRGYCTQTPTPTKILSEYMAQGCIYYATEQITTGLISEEERKTVSSIIDRIKLIDLANVEIIKAVTLDVNLASSAITVNVHETGVAQVDITSSITLNINLASSDITLNIHETGTANVAIISSVQLDINLASSAITVNVHETGVAQVDITSSITLNINIESSAITLNVQTAVGEKVEVGIVSSIQLNINIAGSDITLNIHETGTANVAITSSVTLDMNITGSTIDVPIINATGQSLDVAITSSITVNMTITGSTVNVPVETTTGHVDVDVVTSITLNVNIESSAVTLNVAIQSSAVTLNVNIESQAVDINIKTSGGANIIIDKLTVGAYTERRPTISNNGETPSFGDVPTGNNRVGKFFPRGCRGFIGTIDEYCRSTGIAGTITVYLSPQPSMGAVASAIINVGAGAGADWRSATFNRMWNYDSLFIFTVGSTTDIEHGFDTDAPLDFYESSDSGATWTVANLRLWYRVIMKGETVGDIPVSGTINTIEIRAKGIGTASGSITVPTDTEKSLLKIEGSGTVLRGTIHMGHSGVEIRFYVDGVLVDRYSILGLAILTCSQLNGLGYTPTTPQIQLINFIENDDSMFAFQIPFEFQRSFEVKAHHVLGVDETVYGGVVVNLTK